MEKPSRTTFRIRLETMVQQLRESIISGDLAPGSYLPSEDLLGEQFQLSKKSVRKGLESLVQEKLIVKKPKIGNMVIDPNGTDERITIRFCIYPDADSEMNISMLLNAFEVKYPHIQVKRMTMHTHLYADQAMSFMADGMLDVVMLNYYDFSYFNSAAGSNMLAEQEADPAIYAFLNRAFTVDGKSYVKPFAFSPLILAYNRDHFRDIGLPEPDSSWTWREFAHAAIRLSNCKEPARRYGFFFHLLSHNRWPLWLLQHGFSLGLNEEGRYDLNDDAFVASMQMLRELFSQENTVPSFMFDSAQDPERLFLEERTSMIITTYFRLNHVKSASFDYDISPVPYVDVPKTLLLNVGLGISKHSEHREAAQLLVDYLTSSEAQESLRTHTTSIPSLKEMAEQERSDKGAEPGRYPMFREIIPSFRYYTDMNVNRHQLRTMTHYLKLYWSNLESSSNVIANIEEALNNGS